MTTYFALSGNVMLQDGPWQVRLAPIQCDQLLSIFDKANAVTHFNALWEAMEAAGLGPCTFARKPNLRLVSPVRRMLEASVAAIAAEPQP